MMFKVEVKMIQVKLSVSRKNNYTNQIVTRFYLLDTQVSKDEEEMVFTKDSKSLNRVEVKIIIIPDRMKAKWSGCCFEEIQKM
jgi:hypothetical protein